VLETVGTITAAVLDKTGTLTEGTPKVTDVVPLGRTERQVLSMAAPWKAARTIPSRWPF